MNIVESIQMTLEANERKKPQETAKQDNATQGEEHQTSGKQDARTQGGTKIKGRGE